MDSGENGNKTAQRCSGKGENTAEIIKGCGNKSARRRTEEDDMIGNAHCDYRIALLCGLQNPRLNSM